MSRLSYGRGWACYAVAGIRTALSHINGSRSFYALFSFFPPSYRRIQNAVPFLFGLVLVLQFPFQRSPEFLYHLLLALPAFTPPDDEIPP